MCESVAERNEIPKAIFASFKYSPIKVPSFVRSIVYILYKCKSFLSHQPNHRHLLHSPSHKFPPPIFQLVERKTAK